MTTCLPPGRRTIDVGAHAAIVVAAEGVLLLEVAVLDHAGELDDALQLQLAPAAADAGPLQRVDQAAGFVAEAPARRYRATRCAAAAGRRFDAPALGLLDLAIHLLERPGHRRQQILDRLLALRRYPRSPGCALRRAVLRPDRETPVVGSERIGAKRLEGLAELRADILVRLQSLGLNGAIALELGSKTGLPDSRDQPSDKSSQG